MSIEMWTDPITKKRYPIGTVGREYPTFAYAFHTFFKNRHVIDNTATILNTGEYGGHNT